MSGKLVLFLAALLFLTPACAGPEKAGTADLGAEAAASNMFYASPEKVLAATKKALADYDLAVTGTKVLGPGTWSLAVKKGPTNEFPEEIDRIVVEGRGEDRAGVHIFIDRRFWQFWSGRLPWADTFFTQIHNRLP